MGTIRRCRPDEREAILAIVNAAAEAYRGAIPEDCWHEPYMTARQLDAEIAAGVAFWGFETEDGLVGVMGTQHVRDVELVRHAYVLPGQQGQGIGGRLLAHLERLTTRPILIGTWAAADWAIRFYQHHGFALVPEEQRSALLGAYWTITPRQLETSVVLAKPPRST